MPSFRHATPGSILASQRVIVSDAIASGDTKFTMTQPANSAINAVIVRVLDDLELASSGTLRYKVGTADAGTELHVFKNIIASSTTVSAGSLDQLAVASGLSDGDNGAVVSDDRLIHFTLNSDQDAATNGNGRLEFTVVYRIFD
jgi:hypothetical protein